MWTRPTLGIPGTGTQFWSLRARLLLLLGALWGVALALLGWSLLAVWEHERRETAQIAQRQVASRAAELREKFADIQGMVGMLSQRAWLWPRPPRDACNEALRTAKAQFTYIGSLALTDAQGVLRCSSEPFDPAAPPHYEDRDWFQNPMKTGQFGANGYVYGRVAKRHLLVFSAPAPDAARSAPGVAALGLDLAWLARFMQDLPLPEQSVALVLDADGLVLARYPDHEQWVGKPHPRIERRRLAMEGGERGVFEDTGVDGIPRIYAFEQLRVGATQLTVQVGVGKEAALAPINARYTRALLALVLAGVLALALALHASRRLVSQPLSKLIEAARALAQGQLSARSGVDKNSELGMLGHSFDQMAQAIDSNQHRLERMNRALQVALSTGQDLFTLQDEQSLLAALCQHSVHEGGYAAAWIMRRHTAADGTHTWKCPAVEAAATRDPFALCPDARNLVQEPAQRALQTQSPVLLGALDALPTPQRPPWASAVVLPLQVNGGDALVCVLADQARDAFTPDEVALLARTVHECALSLNALQAQTRERAAAQANRFKSEFLANMSHELRTPLNAVVGFSEVLRDGLAGPVSEQQREYLEDILSSGKHLLALINDILDLSKIEAGKMSLDLDNVEVANLVSGALSIVREKATQHRLQISSEVAPDVGQLCADPRKLKQILFNLLSNALKFTPDGGAVVVRARRVAAPAQAPLPAPVGTVEYLLLEVQDTGIGISPADQARLFTAFTQIDSELSRQYEGTGLGLVLVKRMAQLHGGWVGLESAPSQGSTFRVYLPYRPAYDVPSQAAPLPLASAQQGHAPRTALVIEDDDQAYELLRLALVPLGFGTVRARSAESARTQLEQHHPDLITLDILLPGEHGWQFLAWIKTVPALATIPVVVVSIVADPPGGLLALGAAGVLQKPLDHAELVHTLQRLGLCHGTQARPQTHILIIDDDPKSVEATSLALIAQGYTVHRALSGREGVAMALQTPPDLIVLDLMMPDWDGFAVVSHLRADARTLRTPIAVLSAKSLTEDERVRLQGQVQLIVEKGQFSPLAFAAEVQRAITAPAN